MGHHYSLLTTYNLVSTSLTTYRHLLNFHSDFFFYLAQFFFSLEHFLVLLYSTVLYSYGQYRSTKQTIFSAIARNGLRRAKPDWTIRKNVFFNKGQNGSFWNLRLTHWAACPDRVTNKLQFATSTLMSHTDPTERRSFIPSPTPLLLLLITAQPMPNQTAPS